MDKIEEKHNKVYIKYEDYLDGRAEDMEKKICAIPGLEAREIISLLLPRMPMVDFSIRSYMSYEEKNQEEAAICREIRKRFQKKFALFFTKENIDLLYYLIKEGNYYPLSKQEKDRIDNYIDFYGANDLSQLIEERMIDTSRLAFIFNELMNRQDA